MAAVTFKDQPRAITEAGVLLPGASLLLTFEGTEDALHAFADPELTVYLSNPLVADGAARFPVFYLDAEVAYRARLYHPITGALVWEFDPVEVFPLTDDGTPLDNSGEPMPGAVRTFWRAGTNQLQAIYATDALTTELDNPLTADVDGEFPVVYLDDELSYRVNLKNSEGELVSDYEWLAFATETGSRSFIAGESESPTFPGVTLTGYLDLPGDPYGTGPVGSISALDSYLGFPIVGIFFSDSVRRFTSTSGAPANFPTATITGYLADAAAEFWGTSFGSMAPAFRSYAGYPIVGVHKYAEAAFPVYTRVVLGRNSAGELPTDSFLNAVFLEITDDGGTVTSGFLDGNSGGVGDNAFEWTTNDNPSPLGTGVFEFTLTPDPADPALLVWVVFGRNIDGNLPTAADLAGAEISISSVDEEVVLGSLDTGETYFGPDAIGWGIAPLVDPAFVSGEPYSFVFDPEDP